MMANRTNVSTYSSVGKKRDSFSTKLRNKKDGVDKRKRSPKVAASGLPPRAPGGRPGGGPATEAWAPHPGDRPRNRTASSCGSANGRQRGCATTEDVELEKALVKQAQGAMARHPGPALGGGGASAYRQLTAPLHGLSLVSQHIALGNREDSADIEGLQKMGITHILNAAAEQVRNSHPKDFIYMSLKLADNPQQDLTKYRDKAVGFIQHVERLGGRVLVHCIAGVSRSVSLVIMHLMNSHQMYLRVAFDHIKSIRPYISPNNGFLLQLAKYEVERFGATTVASAPEWNFYEWNALKQRTPKIEVGPSGSSACLIL
mmetsp:Transcript_39444/g.64635  ORF Transcript_39444/g.64635 Transcript_39444/m.64635 type:complete len:316 (+) Transcript_39444:121-1068(+)